MGKVFKVSNNIKLALEEFFFFFFFFFTGFLCIMFICKAKYVSVCLTYFCQK